MAVITSECEFAEIKKKSNIFDKAWESAVSLPVSVTVIVSVSVSVDPSSMLNKFCLRVYV